MRTKNSSFVVELPLRVDDQQNRFLEQAFEFGRTLYNATLGTALGRLQRMRETKEWQKARDISKGRERTKAFNAIHKSFGLTEFGLVTIANDHRKTSGRNDIGAHEAQNIGKTVWKALQRHLFKKAGRPRVKSFKRGLDSIEGSNNQKIMYKPKLGAIVWRKRDHGKLVNDLLQTGGTIKIEKNSYRSYQRNYGRSTNRTGMGEFVEHLKRKADSAGCEVIELNAYELKMSQYDPPTDTYRKKLLKERWHRWGNTDTLVQRDVMSAFLACHVTENGHDRALLLKKWTTAEALLSGSGLCRHKPRNDPEVSRDASGLTKPDCDSNAERGRGLPHTLCSDV